MSRVLIDANVLYPTVMRGIVIGWAESGAFVPLWSERILEEWRRAAARGGPGEARIAEGEIAALTARFPDALVEVGAETLSRLHLPDPDDLHVLAAAIDGHAEELLTMNLRDFPTNALSAEGVVRREPDGFMLESYHAAPDSVRALVRDVLARAGSYGIDVSEPRRVMKKARMPRLGKALFA